MITAYATCNLTGPMEVIRKFHRARLDVVDHLAKSNGFTTYRGETHNLAYVQIPVACDPEANKVFKDFPRLLYDLESVRAGSLLCETDTEK